MSETVAVQDSFCFLIYPQDGSIISGQREGWRFLFNSDAVADGSVSLFQCAAIQSSLKALLEEMKSDANVILYRSVMVAQGCGTVRGSQYIISVTRIRTTDFALVSLAPVRSNGIPVWIYGIFAVGFILLSYGASKWINDEDKNWQNSLRALASPYIKDTRV